MRVARTYCHPEADEDAYDDLSYVANREDDPEMPRFKSELRRAITDPGHFPDDEPSRAVECDDGSSAKFLRRLWQHLYANEPDQRHAEVTPAFARGRRERCRVRHRKRQNEW